MGRGFGTLLIIAIAVSIFTAPTGPGRAGSGGTGALVRSGRQSSPEPPALDSYSHFTPCAPDDHFTCKKCEAFCPSRDLRETIEAFYADQQNIHSGEQLGVPANEGKNIRFVVALVADPAHTHLSLFFDRTIDAIELAAQQSRYIFDRSTMPWDFREHAESTDFRLREAQRLWEREKESMPGLMIFRKADPTTKPENSNIASGDNGPLFVFTVGETPTGGIHKNQFTEALNAIRIIRRGLPETLSIVGPTFSGSLYSLRELLSVPQSGFVQVRVSSGTNTGWETVDWFRRNKPENVCYLTFQESDRYLMQRFIRFAKWEGYKPHEIAVLSEEETAYGSFMVSQVKNPSPSQPPPPTADERDVVQLYFPRDISQLRSAYQHDLEAEETGDTTGRRAPRSTLKLNLEDTGTDEDTVPPYSRLQTPLSQEAVLLGITTTLLQHGVSFVVLRATNPLDQLFLARYLRTAYPQGRIVTIGADLLFRREVDTGLLNGILAIAPYTLIPGAHDAVPQLDPLHHQHADLVLPSTFSTGTFNATVSTLECLKLEFEADGSAPKCDGLSGPPASGNYLEYGWPDIEGGADKLIPPLTLTTLSRYGYWRVALLDGGEWETSDHSNPLVQRNLSVMGADGPRGNEVFVPFPRSHPPKPTYHPPVSQEWKLICGLRSFWFSSICGCSGAVQLFPLLNRWLISPAFGQTSGRALTPWLLRACYCWSYSLDY